MKFKEVVKMIEEHQGRQLSWIELEVFEEFIKKDGFDADMLAEAFKKSILNEAEKPLTYMRTILKEWRKAGIKTVADVKRADDEFEAKKEQFQAQKNKQANQQSSNVPSWSNPNYKAPSYDDILKELDDE